MCLQLHKYSGTHLLSHWLILLTGLEINIDIISFKIFSDLFCNDLGSHLRLCLIFVNKIDLLHTERFVSMILELVIFCLTLTKKYFRSPISLPMQVLRPIIWQI